MCEHEHIATENNMRRSDERLPIEKNTVLVCCTRGLEQGIFLSFHVKHSHQWRHENTTASYAGRIDLTAFPSSCSHPEDSTIALKKAEPAADL